MENKTEHQLSPLRFNWIKTGILTYINAALILIYFIICSSVPEEHGRIMYLLGYRDLYEIKNGDFWGLITGTLFHLDWLHLSFNFIALLLTGYLVEKYYGKVKFCIIWLLGALLPTLPYLLIYNGGLIGISNIIYTFWGILLAEQFTQKKIKAPYLTHLVLGGGFVICFYLSAFEIMNIANSVHVFSIILGVLLSFIIKPGEKYIFRSRKSLIGIMSVTLITLLAFGIISFKGWDRKYFHIFENDEAGCFNCLSQIGLSLRMYSNESDEYFPAGRETAMKSLNLLFGPDGERIQLANCMASHAKQPELWKYFKKHKAVPEHLTCYRYNEGLSESAPVDSIVLYYYKPIKWSCWYCYTDEPGRLILFIDGHKRFHPEAEFQRMQKATIDWIKENKKEEQLLILHKGILEDARNDHDALYAKLKKFTEIGDPDNEAVILTKKWIKELESMEDFPEGAMPAWKLCDEDQWEKKVTISLGFKTEPIVIYVRRTDRAAVSDVDDKYGNIKFMDGHIGAMHGVSGPDKNGKVKSFTLNFNYGATKIIADILLFHISVSQNVGGENMKFDGNIPIDLDSETGEIELGELDTLKYTIKIKPGLKIVDPNAELIEKAKALLKKAEEMKGDYEKASEEFNELIQTPPPDLNK